MRPWLVAIFLSACSAEGLPLTGGGGGSAGGSASGHCADHTDAASCLADSSCAVAACNDCGGKQVFGRCYNKGEPPPTFQCPACTAPCSEYNDQKSCSSDPRCVACIGCPGFFLGCYDHSMPQPAVCQMDNCSSCGTMETEAACMARSDCHPVYTSSGNCGPHACCDTFHACVAGAKANCSGDYCGVQNCQAECGFVPTVVNGCWTAECVKKSECG
jgi:hypothetical protein